MNRSKNLIKIFNNAIINNNGNKNIKFSAYITTVPFQPKNNQSNLYNISTRNYFTNNKFTFSSQSPTSNKNEPINEQKQQETEQQHQSQKIEEQPPKTEEQQPKTEEQQPKTEEQQPKTEEQQPKTEEEKVKTEEEKVKTEEEKVKTEEEKAKTENNEEKKPEPEPEKPKTLKEKIISKLKWGTIIGSITGSIFFLFYESYLRNTLPYKMTMKLVDSDIDVLRAFGGHITGIKWYKCFVNPIFGWVQNEEGGYKSWTVLRIPITRFIAPPPPAPKDGQPPVAPIVLPEDDLFKGYDGGAQEAVIYARLDKNSANFYDWRFEDLQIHCDNNQVIKIVDSEKNKSKL
ncbi:hypothetical protein RB653_003933 [Dictyostelium firmibasis]|uniref:Uncharacterized protein n=1 Tax=Dictyostelium firmibasis TaxID=79012 RepID=A0AAN7Z2X8_9MYCE